MWYLHHRTARLEREAATEYILYMTQKERDIIAYLLHHNQKTFMAAATRPHCCLAVSWWKHFSQAKSITMTGAPFASSDHVWEVLVAHKEKFPYKSPPRGREQPHPWRKHYLE
jgi:hypothetical protein